MSAMKSGDEKASESVPGMNQNKGTEVQRKENAKTSIVGLVGFLARDSWYKLYGGLGASLVGTMVSQGVYFYLYSMLRKIAVARRRNSARSSQDIRVFESLLTASLAGMGNVLLTNPIWMIATRMQSYRNLRKHEESMNKLASTEEEGSVGSEPSSSPPTPLAVAKMVYKEYGISGFWNGVTASLVMVINPTIQYAMYEWLMSLNKNMKNVKRKSKTVRPSTMEIFILSALSKAGATVITYPLMTVKTRMMAARKTDAHLQYTSVWNAITQIAKQEGECMLYVVQQLFLKLWLIDSRRSLFLCLSLDTGLGGYYKGIKTKIAQSILAASLLLVCKEKITEFTRDMLNPKTETE